MNWSFDPMYLKKNSSSRSVSFWNATNSSLFSFARLFIKWENLNLAWSATEGLIFLYSTLLWITFQTWAHLLLNIRPCIMVISISSTYNKPTQMLSMKIITSNMKQLILAKEPLVPLLFCVKSTFWVLCPISFYLWWKIN